MNSRILLTGASGQLGWALRRRLSVQGEIVTPGRELLDLAAPQRIGEVVRALAPDLVVNAAAHTAVDAAESAPQLAFTINRDAPAELARTCRELGVPLVHYSTDYVFDGSGDAPRREDAPVGPLNVYGASKLAGEQAIAASGCVHLILRTSWIYAIRGRNFLLTMLRLADERNILQVIDDQIGAPTWADTLADASAAALARIPRERFAEISGTFHVTAAGCTSWCGYAREIMRVRERETGRAAPRIEPIRSSQYPSPARRPANSRLDSGRFETTFGLRMPTWDEALALALCDHFS